MSDRDEPIPKGQHLVDQAAQLILVVEDDGVDAGVDPHQFKTKLGISLEGKFPSSYGERPCRGQYRRSRGQLCWRWAT